MSRALVLNTTYEPISVVSTRRAAVLVLGEKAVMVEAGNDVWRSERVQLPIPSVIRLRRYVKVPYARSVPLTRNAVFGRDGHSCQYCGAAAESIDHVVPRSRGGAHVWENVVASCRRCNLRKGNRAPEEVGLRLHRRPRRPHQFGWIYARVGPRLDPLWSEYLLLAKPA